MDLVVQYSGEAFGFGVVGLMVGFGAWVGGSSLGSSVVVDGNEHVRVEGSGDFGSYDNRYSYVGGAGE